MMCLIQLTVSASACDEIAAMRRKLQRIGKDRVLSLDETSVRLNEAPTSTVVLPGDQPYVLATDTTSYSRRFDMIACCTGKEVLLPKIFTPKDRSNEGVHGINSQMLLDFIDDELAQAVEGLNRYPFTLVLDRSTIHNKTKILDAFHNISSYSIESILFMPPMSAKRLSPLDNALFHDWKEAIGKHGALTLTNVEQVMADEWNNMKADKIESHYHHCGLMRGADVYADCPAPAVHKHARS